MIEVKNITKKFDDYTALNNVSCTLKNGRILGLVGSNGAGKSTLLRVMSGVYQADGGCVYVDGEPVWENPAVKEKIAYVSDNLFLPTNQTLKGMAKMYKDLFNQFDNARFEELASKFNLSLNKRLGTFSKGMLRQAATILTLARRPEYIFFDETFDGLDPIMRNVIKGEICADVIDRNVCAIITSHSLRELEDTCDSLALIHKGGIVVESEISNLKTQQFKVQIAFSDDYDQTRFADIDVTKFKKSGSVANLIVRGEKDEIIEQLSTMNPSVLEVLPLSLEEVFTYELEALGYKFED